MTDPTVVLVEFFNEHWYKVTIDGQVRFLASVTTKLGVIDKPHLARWRGDLGNREADLRMYDAASRGTRIHWAYATALKGGAVVYDPWQRPVYTDEGIATLKAEHKDLAILRTQEEMWTISRLAEQFNRLHPQVLGVEETVWDVTANDAGTVDSVFKVEEGDYSISGRTPVHLGSGIYINDLKTGKFVDDNVWMQLAPYMVMWEKKHGLEAAGAIVTHTGSDIKTGIPGLRTLVRRRDQLLQDYEDYRHAARLWERQHANAQPATYEFPSVITLKGAA